jgi:hypothetical protein
LPVAPSPPPAGNSDGAFRPARRHPLRWLRPLAREWSGRDPTSYCHERCK